MIVHDPTTTHEPLLDGECCMSTATASLPAAKPRAEKQESQTAIVFRRFLRHRLAVLSLILLVIIFVL